MVTIATASSPCWGQKILLKRGGKSPSATSTWVQKNPEEWSLGGKKSESVKTMKKPFLCCHKTRKSSIVTSVFKPCTKLCTGLCTGIVRSPPSIKCWVVSGPANREEMSKRCGYASADGPFTHLLIKSTILGPETQSFAHGAYFSWFKFMIQHLKLIKKWLDSSISFLAGGLEHFFFHIFGRIIPTD